VPAGIVQRIATAFGFDYNLFVQSRAIPRPYAVGTNPFHWSIAAIAKPFAQAGAFHSLPQRENTV
jgi:hypothetical protein